MARSGGGINKNKRIFVATGIKELDKALKQIPAQLVKKAARKALRQGSKVLQKEMKRRVPVDTGETKKSIKVKAGKRSKTKISMIVKAGDLNFVPKFLEFGTKNMAPRPFVRPAFDAKGEEAKKVILEELAKFIEELNGK